MEKFGIDIVTAGETSPATCGCGSPAGSASTSCGVPERPNCLWITGHVQTVTGLDVPRVATELRLTDRLGAFRSRTGAYRMSYIVPPGLYGVGSPTQESDVLVTSNYKLSFGHLRKELTGRNLWILVLDTKGINVWCAAGKGTFGTDELVGRIGSTNLREIVSHRRLIVPQLGGPGVSAPLVRKKTGFAVKFGPVRAADLPAFLDAGYRADPSMRRVRFTAIDRLILTPMEIRPAMKYFPVFAVIVLVIFGLQPTGILFRPAWTGGYPFLVLGLGSVLSGALLMPVFLPVIPFRSFAVKGWIAGSLVTWGLLYVFNESFHLSVALQFAAILLFPALSSYIGLQFTGSTTFTGMSGVQRELRIGLPAYIMVIVTSIVAVVVDRIKEWGVI